MHPEAFPEDCHTLLSKAVLPQKYQEAASAGHQASVAQLQQLDNEAAHEVQGAAEMTGAMAEEAEEALSGDANSREAFNEDEDYSSSDGGGDDQQVFDFKGIVGIKKCGSSRK